MNDQKICRTCAKKGANAYYNLFFPKENKRSTTFSIMEELQLNWKLPVKNDNIMTQYICEMCYISFYMYFNFKSECLKAQTNLIKLIDSAQQSEGATVSESIELTSQHLDNTDFIRKSEAHSPTFSSISNYSLSSLECDWNNEMTDSPYVAKPQGLKCIYCCESNPPKLDCFKTNLLLEAHIATAHAGGRLYICHLCNSGYISKTSLCDHVRHVHKKERKKAPLCEYCGIFCSSKFDKHVSTHEMGDYCCSTCGETFQNISKQEFNNHQEWHNPKHQCSFCSKQFVQLGHLKTHLGTHKEYAKEHVCQFCNKEFVYRYTLNHHITIQHERKKPLKCNFCDKRYKTGTAKIMHMRRYHDYFLKCGKKNWLCRGCGKRCYRESHVCPVVKNNPQST